MTWEVVSARFRRKGKTGQKENQLILKTDVSGGKKMKQNNWVSVVTYHRFWMVSYHRQGWDGRAMNADLKTKQQTFKIPFTRSRETLQMRSIRVVRASDWQHLRHNGIWRAADEAVLNKVHKKSKKNPHVNFTNLKKYQHERRYLPWGNIIQLC